MNDALEKRLEYLQTLFLDKKHALTNQVVFALFSCFTPDDLATLYIEKMEITWLRQKVRQHLIYCIKQHGSTQFINFLDQLFALLTPYKSQRSIWINSLIYAIILYFPNSYIERYFKILLESHRTNDKDRAYTLAAKMWANEIEDVLWREWHESKSEQCLVTLVQHGNIDQLKKNFKPIWFDPEITDKTKRDVLFRIAESDFAFSEEVRSTHPITYLYCVTKTSKHLPPEIAYNLSLKVENIKELSIAIWCIGQFGYWDMIKKINKEMLSLLERIDNNGAVCWEK